MGDFRLESARGVRGRDTSPNQGEIRLYRIPGDSEDATASTDARQTKLGNEFARIVRKGDHLCRGGERHPLAHEVPKGVCLLAPVRHNWSLDGGRSRRLRRGTKKHLYGRIVHSAEVFPTRQDGQCCRARNQPRPGEQNSERAARLSGLRRRRCPGGGWATNEGNIAH